jgi:hypothetical protein
MADMLAMGCTRSRMQELKTLVVGHLHTCSHTQVMLRQHLPQRPTPPAMSGCHCHHRCEQSRSHMCSLHCYII